MALFTSFLIRNTMFACEKAGAHISALQMHWPIAFIAIYGVSGGQFFWQKSFHVVRYQVSLLSRRKDLKRKKKQLINNFLQYYVKKVKEHQFT